MGDENEAERTSQRARRPELDGWMNGDGGVGLSESDRLCFACCQQWQAVLPCQQAHNASRSSCSKS